MMTIKSLEKKKKMKCESSNHFKNKVEVEGEYTFLGNVL